MGEVDLVTQRIIGCAIEVHRALGPGLLESAYQKCMAHEMHLQGIAFRLEVPIPIEYKSVHLDCGFRIDMLVCGVVIELKSVERLTPVHESQVLTYMKLAKLQTGLLINFNERRLVEGIRRLKL